MSTYTFLSERDNYQAQRRSKWSLKESSCHEPISGEKFRRNSYMRSQVKGKMHFIWKYPKLNRKGKT